MATTAYGLPYPLGTDFVVNGDNDIRALAEKIDQRPYAIAYRGTSPGTIPSSIYVEMSAGVFWKNQANRGMGGLPAAGQGFTVPYAGRYLVQCYGRFTGSVMLGVAKNVTGNQGNAALIIGNTAPMVQGIALVTFAGIIDCAANDKLNLYGLATADTTWLTDQGYFGVQWIGA